VDVLSPGSMSMLFSGSALENCARIRGFFAGKGTLGAFLILANRSRSSGVTWTVLRLRARMIRRAKSTWAGFWGSIQSTNLVSPRPWLSAPSRPPSQHHVRMLPGLRLATHPPKSGHPSHSRESDVGAVREPPLHSPAPCFRTNDPAPEPVQSQTRPTRPRFCS
jgi:hypothetical protein